MNKKYGWSKLPSSFLCVVIELDDHFILYCSQHNWKSKLYFIATYFMVGRRQLRSASSGLYSPWTRTKMIGPRSFKVSGLTIWNDFPASMKDPTLKTLRYQPKMFLFDGRLLRLTQSTLFKPINLIQTILHNSKHSIDQIDHIDLFNPFDPVDLIDQIIRGINNLPSKRYHLLNVSRLVIILFGRVNDQAIFE